MATVTAKPWTFTFCEPRGALHHSWTPSWYKALSREAVLAQDCRLSAVLRHLLRE